MTTPTATSVAYTIDPTHSHVQFSVRHLMISKVRGSFTTVSGSVTLGPEGAIPTAIDAEIAANSINTRDAQRDGHLMSPDFLDAATYPTLSFKSTDITAVDATNFTAAGILELHGVKQPITLKGEVTGRGKDPWGNDRIGYEAGAKLSRKDFGLVWNQALEAGGVAVGDEIDITLDIEVIPQPA